ncbi:MAG: putative toxin-antitoxin system toxin component, PIN family [Deltaproteobacteria bacterium]|nr:putative toxin-antitoxin system toxin component, PIN family [Deltaproteobacteria bacterium]
MIRTVFDTNVLVSALLCPASPPAKLLELALQGKIRLILSPHILQEVERVFFYPKIQRILKRRGIEPGELEEVIARIVKVTVITSGKLTVQAVPADPADDLVLAGALEGQAEFVVSGDHHLTDLKGFAGIKIIEPAAFLQACLETEA